MGLETFIWHVCLVNRRFVISSLLVESMHTQKNKMVLWLSDRSMKGKNQQQNNKTVVDVTYNHKRWLMAVAHSGQGWPKHLGEWGKGPGQQAGKGHHVRPGTFSMYKI